MTERAKKRNKSREKGRERENIEYCQLNEQIVSNVTFVPYNFETWQLFLPFHWNRWCILFYEIYFNNFVYRIQLYKYRGWLRTMYFFLVHFRNYLLFPVISRVRSTYFDWFTIIICVLSLIYLDWTLISSVDALQNLLAIMDILCLCCAGYQWRSHIELND